ncbi:transglutaminase-like domain-containing protein [Singulisphaera acidiphila]|uniref:Transglutaminase-like enzyme, predicted cysteine protease n=1 Tax=Singulisphaera acidiphila (strain ATCC BAA-1392 / DSM 18658 / VKM B-2454 / MOB10) TaxID=886293 RepID=L0DL14_SINAD|nr:transglutaminase family protein [Singulisphaera acidiphila]AGA29922.1 transglutaminase-like enzyme, predicted cysteine protease [Singulisphaera acidiphila DSM 18658]
MLIRIGYELVFQIPSACPMTLMLGLRPERATSIRRAAGMKLDPVIPIESFTDGFGNLGCRIVAPPGRLVLLDDSIVEDDGSPDPVAPGARQLPVEELPADVLVYLLGSRYCEVDRLLDIAWKLFAKAPLGWGRVQAICDWVHHNIRFGYSFARPTKTAYDVYVERTGVCRDFTHLALTFCRCMNIPARYATGYLGDIGIPPQPCPMDFSGWFEAYLDGRWYTFDARHNVPRIGRVVMARGRDAVDVALTTSFGANTLESFTVWTDEVTEPELSPPAHELIRAAANRIVTV